MAKAVATPRTFRNDLLPPLNVALPSSKTSPRRATTASAFGLERSLLNRRARFKHDLVDLSKREPGNLDRS